MTLPRLRAGAPADNALEQSEPVVDFHHDPALLVDGRRESVALLVEQGDPRLVDHADNRAAHDSTKHGARADRCHQDDGSHPSSLAHSSDSVLSSRDVASQVPTCLVSAYPLVADRGHWVRPLSGAV